MSEILCITVQCDPIFHSIPLGPCLGMPMKDTSPKARKSQDVLARFVPDGVLNVLVSRKQDVKTFLCEVMVVGEHFRQTFTAHDVHGNAVRKAICLIGACPVQRQAIQKEGASNLDNTHTGVIE